MFASGGTQGDNRTEDTAAVAKALGRQLSEDELVSAVAEMDDDGDGTVDKTEFEGWWAKQLAAEQAGSKAGGSGGKKGGGGGGFFNGGSKAIRRQLRLKTMSGQLGDAAGASLALHYGFAKVPGSGAGRRGGRGLKKDMWK
eukprot:SAG22_NODE_2351_length_2677_cov_5.504267_4_plen_140_part_01